LRTPIELYRKDPAAFQTSPTHCQRHGNQLRITYSNETLDFAALQQRRQQHHPVSQNSTSASFSVNNIGVSVAICVHHQARRFLLCVAQQRPDFDRPEQAVLKLISGYVATPHLQQPHLAVLEEIVEELWIEKQQQFYRLAVKEHGMLALPEGSAQRLPIMNDTLELTPTIQTAQQIFIDDIPLQWQPDWYHHLPSNSLQLVYCMDWHLPDDMGIDVFHYVEEQYDTQQQCLRAVLDNEHAYFLECSETGLSGQVLQWREQRWQTVEENAFILSEYFAPRKNQCCDAQDIDLPQACEHFRWPAS